MVVSVGGGSTANTGGSLVQRGFGLVPQSLVNLNASPKPASVGGSGRGGATSMPFDADEAASLQQAAAARQTYLSTLKNQRSELNQGFGNQLQDLVTQHPLDQASLNSNYGSSGLGFSSGYGNADQHLSDAYNKAQTRLEEAHQNAIKDLILNRQNYMREYRTNVSGLRQAAADRLSALAGGLGLAPPTTNALLLSNMLNGTANG